MQTTVSTPPALPLGANLLKEEAIAKFKSKTASVGIIGLGYVGLLWHSSSARKASKSRGSISTISKSICLPPRDPTSAGFPKLR
jgi:hypothetical protein